MLRWIKRKWTNWIHRLAKQNQASFGHQRLDCCSVDKGQKRDR